MKEYKYRAFDNFVKKYKVIHSNSFKITYSNYADEVETEKKESPYHKWFDNFEDAKDFLIEQNEKKIKRIEKQLNKLERLRNKLNELKEYK